MSTIITMGANKSLTIEPQCERCVNIILSRSGGAVTTGDQIIYNNMTLKAALDYLYAHQGTGGGESSSLDYMDILILS